MAPMITDSYLKYSNSEFGSNKQSYYSSNKPPIPSMSYSSDQQQSKYNSFNDNSLNGFNNSVKRPITEENIIEILKGNFFILFFFKYLIFQTKKFLSFFFFLRKK